MLCCVRSFECLESNTFFEVVVCVAIAGIVILKQEVPSMSDIDKFRTRMLTVSNSLRTVIKVELLAASLECFRIPVHLYSVKPSPLQYRGVIVHFREITGRDLFDVSLLARTNSWSGKKDLKITPDSYASLSVPLLISFFVSCLCRVMMISEVDRCCIHTLLTFRSLPKVCSSLALFLGETLFTATKSTLSILHALSYLH